MTLPAIDRPDAAPALEPAALSPAPPLVVPERTPPRSVGAVVDLLRARLTSRDAGGHLARGAIWSFAMNMGNMVLGFVVQIVLARSLGRTAYGTYLYALAGMNLALLFAKLEFDGASVRFVGSYAGQQRWGMMHGFMIRSREIVGVASALVAVAGLAAVWLFRARLAPELAITYVVSCALLVATALLQLEAAYLQGFRRVVWSQAPNMLVRPVLFIGGVLALVHLVGMPGTPAMAVAVNLGATIVALAMTMRFRSRAMPAEVRAAPAEFETNVWVHAVGGFLLINFFQTILSTQSDVLVVGSFLGPGDAASYGVASQLITFVGFGGVAIAFAATPMFADLYSRKRHDELQRVVRLAVLGAFAFAVPVLLGLVVLGPLVLRLFGKDFGGAYPILMVLGIGAIVGASVGQMAGFIMTMTGRQYQGGVIIGASAMLNLGLTFVLTPRYGVLGAAAATTVAALVRSTVLVIYIWRTMGLRVLPLP